MSGGMCEPPRFVRDTTTCAGVPVRFCRARELRECWQDPARSGIYSRPGVDMVLRLRIISRARTSLKRLERVARRVVFEPCHDRVDHRSQELDGWMDRRIGADSLQGAYH